MEDEMFAVSFSFFRDTNQRKSVKADTSWKRNKK
jgi:hypothetical protein